MQSNRLSIILVFDDRVEEAEGVFEPKEREKKVIARRLQVYQKRLNQAQLEGLVINGRYKVKTYLIDAKLKYVKIKDSKYKVNTVYTNVNSHYSEIEIGEQI